MRARYTKTGGDLLTSYALTSDLQKYLAPINHSLTAVGANTNFSYYVEKTYIPVVLPLMAATTKGRYEGIFDDYLKTAFGQCSLGEITPLAIQRYFSNSTNFPDLQHESIDKIRDVLSSIMRSAVEYGMIVGRSRVSSSWRLMSSA